jgi:hypothetical protein
MHLDIKLPMNRILLFTFLWIMLSAGTAENDYRTIPFESFAEGEEVSYRVHYGFITAGEAVMRIDNRIHRLNDRPCYKIDVFGKTTGLANKLFGVNNNWGTYLDTAAVVPHKAYRYIREGGYRKNEVVNFEQLNKRVRVNRLNKSNEKIKKIDEYEVPHNVQDMVSGYYFLRTLDYTKYREGDVIKVDAFFDDTVFNFSVRFMGREELKTKLGTYQAIVLKPVMPENKIFEGEDPITVWISDDKYKIPLKIEANMVVGSVDVDIKDFRKAKK